MFNIFPLGNLRFCHLDIMKYFCMLNEIFVCLYIK